MFFYFGLTKLVLLLFWINLSIAYCSHLRLYSLSLLLKEHTIWIRETTLVLIEKTNSIIFGKTSTSLWSIRRYRRIFLVGQSGQIVHFLECFCDLIDV